MSQRCKLSFHYGDVKRSNSKIFNAQRIKKVNGRIGFNISANPWKCMKIVTKVFQYFNVIKDLRISEIGLI